MSEERLKSSGIMVRVLPKEKVEIEGPKKLSLGSDTHTHFHTTKWVENPNSFGMGVRKHIPVQVEEPRFVYVSELSVLCGRIGEILLQPNGSRSFQHPYGAKFGRVITVQFPGIYNPFNLHFSQVEIAKRED